MERSRREHPPYLRLVWSRPETAPLLAHHALLPTRRVNLAHAVERHLRGDDGLTEQEFLEHYAKSRPR